jgi:hypothetical protein
MASAIPFAAIPFAAMSRAAATAARALAAPAVKVCAAVAGTGSRKQLAAIPQWVSGTEVSGTEVSGTEVVARRGTRLGAARPRPTIEHFELVNMKVAVH